MENIQLLGMKGITWEKNKAKYIQFQKEEILLYFYENKLSGYCFNDFNKEVIKKIEKLKGKTFEEIANNTIELIPI